MKALSLWPEWAMPVMLGQKTVECRSWSTPYRGPLLVCSSSRPLDGCVHGHALCVVDLVAVEPFDDRHIDAAMLWDFDVPEGQYAWVFENVRMVEPFPVKGRQRLFDVPDGSVTVLGEPSRELVERYVLPIAYRQKGGDFEGIWADVFEDLGW